MNDMLNKLTPEQWFRLAAFDRAAQFYAQKPLGNDRTHDEVLEKLLTTSDRLYEHLISFPEDDGK